MKISLQVVTRDEIVNKKRVVEYGEKTFDLDVSLACQMRWEAKFPELAAKEDLIDYAQRIKEAGSTSAAGILSMLKTVYCFFDTDMTFTRFLKMFDFSNAEYTERLVSEIKDIFEIVLEGAAEKN